MLRWLILRELGIRLPDAPTAAASRFSVSRSETVHGMWIEVVDNDG